METNPASRISAMGAFLYPGCANFRVNAPIDFDEASVRVEEGEVVVTAWKVSRHNGSAYGQERQVVCDLAALAEIEAGLLRACRARALSIARKEWEAAEVSRILVAAGIEVAL